MTGNNETTRRLGIVRKKRCENANKKTWLDYLKVATFIYSRIEISSSTFYGSLSVDEVFLSVLFRPINCEKILTKIWLMKLVLTGQ